MTDFSKRHKLPEGCSSALISDDGKVTYVKDPFLKDMKWKGLSVDSQAFKSLPPDQKFYEQSKAFLKQVRRPEEWARNAWFVPSSDGTPGRRG